MPTHPLTRFEYLSNIRDRHANNRRRLHEAGLEPNPKYLCFFHNSDNLIEEFNPRDPVLQRGNYPSFYWFSDSFFDYLSMTPGKYFYLFLKNPILDNLELRARHEGLEFHGLYFDYLGHKITRDKLYAEGKLPKPGCYTEPSIIMSFSVIKPDLIAEYSETTKLHTILKPESVQGTTFSLFDERGIPVPFNKIQGFPELFPQLARSFPFIVPEENDEPHFYYEDWVPMITEEMGTWM